jgi:hypothetical protein
VSKEERRREREEQREAEVVEALDKMRFLEGKGVDVEVTPDGKAAGFIPGRGSLEGTGGWDDAVKHALDDLHQMHKSGRERSIILEAWERFQDEDA